MKAFLIGVFLLIVLVLVLHIADIPVFAPLSHWIGRPLWKTGASVGDGAGTFASFFTSKAALQKENEDLKDQLFSDEVKLFELDVAKTENDQLKTMLNRPDKKKGTVAGVLVRPSYSPYDTFIIDAGEDHGIKSGDVVSVEGVAAVGYVSNVYGKTSVVTLYSTPGEKLMVLLAGTKNGAQADGRGNGNFELKLPRDVEAQVGGKITLPGLSGEIIGTIVSIEDDLTHSQKTILFRYPFSLSETRYVFVESSN